MQLAISAVAIGSHALQLAISPTKSGSCRLQLAASRTKNGACTLQLAISAPENGTCAPSVAICSAGNGRCTLSLAFLSGKKDGCSFRLAIRSGENAGCGEMGPVDYAPGQAVGAPDHPHRGFETVTYVLEGEFKHEDSAGQPEMAPTVEQAARYLSGLIRRQNVFFLDGGSCPENITAALDGGARVLKQDQILDALDWTPLLPILNLAERPYGRAGQGLNVLAGHIAMAALGVAEGDLVFQCDSASASSAWTRTNVEKAHRRQFLSAARSW